MSITFVNGFLCTSTCDVAKAKRGVDPHPKPDPTQPDGKADTPDRIKPASAMDRPAVVFGGSLANGAVSPALSIEAVMPVSRPAMVAVVDLLI